MRIGLRLLPLFVAVLFVSVAEASPIVFFETDRSLQANGELFENHSAGAWSASSTADGEGFFENGHQISTISPSYIGGTGLASALSRTSANGDADVRSQLLASFGIDVPYLAMLDVGISASDDASAGGFLFNHDTQTMLAQVLLTDAASRLQYDGILTPGLYSFYLLAQMNAAPGPYQGTSSFVGGLALEPFTPVPEPATLTLFGLGLAAAAWRRRSGIRGAVPRSDRGRRPR